MIGQSLTYQVGVLRYPSNVSTVAVAVAVPIVALVIVAVLVIVGVLVLIHRRKHKKGYVLLCDLEFGWPMHHVLHVSSFACSHMFIIDNIQLPIKLTVHVCQMNKEHTWELCLYIPQRYLSIISTSDIVHLLKKAFHSQQTLKVGYTVH